MELNSDPVEHIVKVMDSRLLDIQDKLILLPNIDSNVKNITSRNPIRYHNKAHGNPISRKAHEGRQYYDFLSWISFLILQYYAKNWFSWLQIFCRKKWVKDRKSA